MAELLNFDTGLKEFTINGAYTLRFNPTDSAFIERVFDALDKLDKLSEQYRARIPALSNKEVFNAVREFDAKAREIIDNALDSGLCTAVFGGMNIVTTLAGGLPVWANLLLALVDEFDSSFTAEKAKTNPRIAKYTEKYRTKGTA